MILPLDGIKEDKIPRENTSLEQLAKLNPVFDKESGNGSLTAGNSSLLTDGAAGLLVCGSKAKEKFSDNSYAAQLVDWEIAAVNIEKEGLLMATTFAIPRLMARHKLRYDNIDLWEVHEAFGAQVAANVQLLEDKITLKRWVFHSTLERSLGPISIQMEEALPLVTLSEQLVQELLTRPLRNWHKWDPARKRWSVSVPMVDWER